LAKKIQIIYAPGTFGNLLRWLLDKFSPNTKFKNIDYPWDKDNRVHSFATKLYNDQFSSQHVLKEGVSANPLINSIVINYQQTDLLFVERCAFYRLPGRETEQGQYQKILSLSSLEFINKTFGSKNTSNRSVAKELYKIWFHDYEKNVWWNEMKKWRNNSDHYQIPLNAFWNKDQFIKELLSISHRWSLGLVVNEDIMSAIVKKISKLYPVITKYRAYDVLQAIKENVNMDCSEMDILEQAWLETVLEKKHDCIVFPYGTNWFKDTDQIREFLDTYPTYLKHMNPRLPWYNDIKNPFYLTGKIDEQNADKGSNEKL